MACTSFNDETEIKRLKVSGRMPSRQWTTDVVDLDHDQQELMAKTKAISSPMVMSANSTAFLLRPVSRNSKNDANEFNPKSPAARAAIAAAVAAAGGGRTGHAKYGGVATGSDHRISLNSLGRLSLGMHMIFFN